jgi:hypothetical protein
MKLRCTSNDCGTLKSRVPKLGLILLGRLVRGPGIRVLSFPLPHTYIQYNRDTGFED